MRSFLGIVTNEKWPWRSGRAPFWQPQGSLGPRPLQLGLWKGWLLIDRYASKGDSQSRSLQPIAREVINPNCYMRSPIILLISCCNLLKSLRRGPAVFFWKSLGILLVNGLMDSFEEPFQRVNGEMPPRKVD